MRSSDATVPDHPVSDVWRRAQEALANSPLCRLRELHVEHVDGALLITGTVSSFYHKQLAQEAVLAVAGETHVVNRVEVRYGEAQEDLRAI